MRSSPSNPPDGTIGRGRAKLLRRLADRKGRAREGLVLVEGPRVVETALAWGARFRFVLGTAEALRSEERLAADLRAAGVDVAAVEPGELEEVADTETPQGLLGVAEEPRSDLPDQAGGERILVLDAVQDPGNVGTLVRAAAAFGTDRVIVLDGTSDPWSPKVVRASAGLVFALPVHREAAEPALDWLRRLGLPLLVADAGGDDVRTAGGPRDPEGGFALLVGNEARGARPLAREHAAQLLALPLAPGVESLNAAMAGTLLLWVLGPGGPGVRSRASDASTGADD